MPAKGRWDLTGRFKGLISPFENETIPCSIPRPCFWLFRELFGAAD
jgi:hypothetical protein